MTNTIDSCLLEPLLTRTLDFTSYIYCLLPSVTRPVDNLNFPAQQQQQQQHQQFIEVGNIEFISKQLCQFFVFAFSIVILKLINNSLRKYKGN